MGEYGKTIAADTVRIERLLPGPIERVWAYLTDPDKRSRWLAGGPMDLRVGGTVRLEFEHAHATDHEEPVPERYRDCPCMTSEGRVTRCEPPAALSFTWDERDGSASEVLFELTEREGGVLLRVTHSRLRGRDEMLGVSAGWHAHLDILGDEMRGGKRRAFWSNHERLEREYAEMFDAPAGA